MAPATGSAASHPRRYSAPATRHGFLAIASTTVEDLTGRAPRSVREVLEAHRDELAGVPA